MLRPSFILSFLISLMAGVIASVQSLVHVLPQQAMYLLISIALYLNTELMLLSSLYQSPLTESFNLPKQTPLYENEQNER